MKIEVSNGEIIDKLTILKIKLDQIKDADKLVNIQKEYDYLQGIVESIYAEFKDNHAAVKELQFLHNDLLNVNKTLWNIEDFIREHERNENFGQDFIELARSVYYTNDDRSEVKKKINILTGSLFVEEKSYEAY
jgi:NCAIR mutase (PurE)-related protein